MRRGDLIAGLSVAGLLLPESVAYAGIAGLPPQRAIFAGIVGCLAYSAFGRSRFAIVSATSASAAILAAALAAMPAGNVARAASATVVVALVGVFLCVAAAARLGSLTSFISRPVLRGFAFGLAVTIIIRQLPTLVGVPLDAPGVFSLVVDLFAALPRWNPVSLTIGCIALVVLLLFRRFPGVPGPFLVLAAGIAASLVLRNSGLSVVGSMSTVPTFPALPVFALSDYARLARLTLPLALILFAESWGTVRALALRHGDKVEANRELAALGLANLASALVQGMPVGAGFSAGAASEAAGAVTRSTSVVAALGLAFLLIVAGPLVARLPEAVLSAVVIAALTPSLDPAPLLRLWQLRRDQYVALGAAAAVLALGVLDGMLVAIILSLAAVLRRLAAPQVARLGRLGATHDYVDLARHPDAVAPKSIAIWRPTQPLFFANADRLLGLIGDQSRADPDIRAVIVSLEESFDLDSSALDALLEFDRLMQASGLPVSFARVHDHIRDLFVSEGTADLQRRSSYSVDDAVSAVDTLLRDEGSRRDEASKDG